MKKQDIKIGQKVHIEPVGNALRNGNEIIETVITKIGTKYIETMYFGDRVKFRIDNGREKDLEYGHGYDYVLHLTCKEIEDSREKDALSREMYMLFRGNNTLSLEQLRRIKEIVDVLESDVKT